MLILGIPVVPLFDLGIFLDMRSVNTLINYFILNLLNIFLTGLTFLSISLPFPIHSSSICSGMQLLVLDLLALFRPLFRSLIDTLAAVRKLPSLKCTKLGIMLWPLKISSENGPFADTSGEYTPSICIISCAVHFSLNFCSNTPLNSAVS